METKPKLILLPGNSLRNRDWLYHAGAHYAETGWFAEIYLHEYEHWQTGETEIDMPGELLRFQAALHADTPHQYVIIAKSIGSIMALLAIQKEFITPTHCVFFGMPLEIAGSELFKADWSPLGDLSVPTIAFHNDRDPISYEVTKAKLTEHAPHITLITREADNHDYTEFAEFDGDIKAHLNA